LFSLGYNKAEVCTSGFSEGCKREFRICFEKFWSPSGNCNAGNIICNQDCKTYKSGENGSEILTVNYNPLAEPDFICSNKVVIFIDCGYFEFNQNPVGVDAGCVSIGSSLLFLCGGCCYKITFDQMGGNP